MASALYKAENRAFKYAAFDDFRRNYQSSRLLIAVDPSKFCPPVEEMTGICPEGNWSGYIQGQEIRSSIVIVTCSPPPELSSQQKLIDEEIERFRSQGIHVDVVDDGQEEI